MIVRRRRVLTLVAAATLFFTMAPDPVLAATFSRADVGVTQDELMVGCTEPAGILSCVVGGLGRTLDITCTAPGTTVITVTADNQGNQRQVRRTVTCPAANGTPTLGPAPPTPSTTLPPGTGPATSIVCPILANLAAGPFGSFIGVVIGHLRVLFGCISG